MAADYGIVVVVNDTIISADEIANIVQELIAAFSDKEVSISNASSYTEGTRVYNTKIVVSTPP